jgi:hypothetical protein
MNKMFVSLICAGALLPIVANGQVSTVGGTESIGKITDSANLSMTTFAWWEWKCSIRVEVAKRRRAAPLFVILSEGSRTILLPVASASKKPVERNAI